MSHVQMAVLALLGFAPGGGEDERGLALLEQGKYAEAAAAFRAAIEADGPSAERWYNLAVALWKAGQLDEAETAAEQAATLSDGALNMLRDGLLGNLRYAAAKNAEAEDLQAALSLAEQARDHYLRGAVKPHARPELARNLERALKLIEELKKKIEEQEKKDEEKKDDEKNDDEKKDDEKKDEQKKDEKQDEQQKKDGEGEQPPEPKPDEEQKPEDQQGEDKKDEQQKPPPPAPGEQLEGRELTPEEKKRLLDKLDELEKMRLELRKQQKAKRPKVKRDW